MKISEDNCSFHNCLHRYRAAYLSSTYFTSSMVGRTRLEVLAELSTARSLVQQLEDELISIQEDKPTASIPSNSALSLSLREYQRYGRQMILTEIGLPGIFFFFSFRSDRVVGC